MRRGRVMRPILQRGASTAAPSLALYASRRYVLSWESTQRLSRRLTQIPSTATAQKVMDAGSGIAVPKTVGNLTELFETTPLVVMAVSNIGDPFDPIAYRLK